MLQIKERNQERLFNELKLVKVIEREEPLYNVILIGEQTDKITHERRAVVYTIQEEVTLQQAIRTYSNMADQVLSQDKIYKLDIVD